MIERRATATLGRAVLLLVLAFSWALPAGAAGNPENDETSQLLEALEAARRAQELRPRDPAVLLEVGRLLVRIGAPSEALRTFATVRTVDPTNVDGYVLAALVLRDVERHGEAVELLEQGLGRGIRDPRLAEELGFLLLAVGKPGRAREVATGALDGHGGRGGLKLVVGLALAADPELRADALPWLEEALELGAPGPGKVHLEIATLLIEAGRADEAVVHLREAERLLPDVPEVYYRLGTALRTTGDLDGARVALLRYQELSRKSDAADWDSKEAGTELNEIQALANGNRLPEALKRIEEMIGRYPGEDRALGLKAKILFSMGKKDEALSTAVAAREAMPSRVEHHYLEGLFLASLGRLEEAEKALGRALALDETRGEAHELLARLLAHRSRFEEAAEHFRKALDAGTDGAELRRAYAEVLKRLGREEESEEQMAAYRRLQGGR